MPPEENDAAEPRRAGRVLVLDPAGRILLLQGFDPAVPDYRFWFTIGGGADPGESLAQAAARELREESGIVADAAALGEPIWRRVARFSYNGQPYRQEEEYFALRTGAVEVSLDGLDEEERATVTAHRWWSAAELEATSEPFVPPELPRLMRELNGAEPSQPGQSGRPSQSGRPG
jgi:8-oxo-dGTP pyrophosphatase MutT (NUDIX family)